MLYVVRVLCLSFFCLLLNGCVSHDKLVNYKEDYPRNTSTGIDNPPEIRIQPNDVLDIKVHSSDMATAAPFNLIPVDLNQVYGDLETIQLNGYLVDRSGSIDFPIVGKIELTGLNIPEAKEKILSRLSEYLKEPIVNIRLLNFRITVSGEVTQPGSFTILNERITLPEAISRAGDLTDYADRSRVLIVREENGMRHFERVNMHSAQLFNSPFYYLQQNDLIYVEPLKAKTGAIGDQGNEAVSFVVAGATLIAVMVSILK